MIDEFGPRVLSIWNDLRSSTRTLVERAWQSSRSGSVAQIPRATHYDPRADQELSRLLTALDARVRETESTTPNDASRRARDLADTCANLLTQQTQSAEVFGQLIGRAHQRKEYARIDALANLMSERLAPSEICELARSNDVIVRALAHEALVHMPAGLLAILLHDPVDGIIARQALERQSTEFASEEAQRALSEFESLGLNDS